jgi:hypothetical protein
MPGLTRQEKLDAQEIFAAGNACEHCGGIHKRACPRVKRIEKLGNGNVTAVEYFRKYDGTGIVWPEDAYDPDDPEDARG